MANQVVPRENRLDGKPSSPRNNKTLNWSDFITSSWKDTDYKRRAIASLVQAVYLLELDRQENRTKEDSLAPKFWTPFNYKPTQILVDERDGSIFGAIFEFDRLAALADFKPFKPIGAPKAVLALRGTLIRLPTMRRDFEDDFRFVTRESLNGSARFRTTLDAVKSVSDRCGSRNVCIAGHSLGAGFGLQVGKELAKERINLEAHLFNPPSVSLAMSFGDIEEKTKYLWNRVRSMLLSSREAQVINDEDKTNHIRLKRLILRLSRLMDAGSGKGQWVPHLYVNCNDWISFFYIHTDGPREKIIDMENMDPTNKQNAGAAKLFVVSKEDQPFLEAHGLKQWWSSDAELKQDVHDSKLINMELRSLNTGTASQVVLFYYPQYVSLATVSLINFREAGDCVWNRLKIVPHLTGKAQISNVGEWTSSLGLKCLTWIPQLSGLKDASYWMCNWVPHLYVNKNDGTKEKVVYKENIDPANWKITSELCVFFKEQHKFVSNHGLKQWWPSERELQQAIHDGKLISKEIRSLYTSTTWEVAKTSNPLSIALAACLSNIRERDEFKWKWNSLNSMFPSSSDAQMNNGDDKILGVPLKSWMPSLADFKAAGFGVVKWVPHMYSNNSDYISNQVRSLYSAVTSVSHLCNLPSVSPVTGLLNMGEKANFVWNRLKSTRPSSSEAHVSNDAEAHVSNDAVIPQRFGLKDTGFGVSKLAAYLYANKSGSTRKKMVDKENKDPLQ